MPRAYLMRYRNSANTGQRKEDLAATAGIAR
jgi:hypothetical protein